MGEAVKKWPHETFGLGSDGLLLYLRYRQKLDHGKSMC